MSFAKKREILRYGILGTVATAMVGCPGGVIDGGDPPLAAFSVPQAATATRIRGGDTVVYTVPNQNNREYEFYLAEPNESRQNHELIGTMPASQLGIEENEQLVAPNTISFSDNLDRAVIGFDDGSFVLQPNGGTAAQFVGTFTAFPINAFGGPVFNPTVSPFGDRLAFETRDGRVGVGDFNDLGTISNFGLMDFGVNPVFGSDGTLGFADPTFDSFYVNDFNSGTVQEFDTDPALVDGLATPFDRFEAGLTPSGIGGVGGFVRTRPLAVDRGPFL